MYVKGMPGSRETYIIIPISFIYFQISVGRYSSAAMLARPETESRMKSQNHIEYSTSLG